MFLIHDDETKTGKRGKHGGPCADDHVDIAGANALPLVVTFAILFVASRVIRLRDVFGSALED